MRVLWICNIMLPVIAKKLQMNGTVKEGWITGLFSRVIQQGKNSKMSLAVAFPMDETMENFHETYVLNGMAVECFGFYEDAEHPEIYNPALRDRFEDIYRMFQPDVVHIFGTEYGHALAAVRALRKPEKALLEFQGIISECAREYMGGLPEEICRKKSLRDFLKNDGLTEQKRKFEQRGRREIEAVQHVRNVTGRTEFDRAFCQDIDDSIRYYKMNETMRPCFYDGQWELSLCKKHQIFFSQADYPLKGFHILLQAMPKILKSYPDATVAVAGQDIVHKKGLLGPLKVSAYGKYLNQLIVNNGLQGKVEFLGVLSAEEMKEAYLGCHTFVCASSLENSPNSVAEAMLLGVPVVASRTGGIPSMITDRKEGLLFEKGNAAELADRVMELWENSANPIISRLSGAEKERAQETHNPAANYERLMEIYQAVSEQKA